MFSPFLFSLHDSGLIDWSTRNWEPIDSTSIYWPLGSLFYPIYIPRLWITLLTLCSNILLLFSLLLDFSVDKGYGILIFSYPFLISRNSFCCTAQYRKWVETHQTLHCWFYPFLSPCLHISTYPFTLLFLINWFVADFSSQHFSSRTNKANGKQCHLMIKIPPRLTWVVPPNQGL